MELFHEMYGRYYRIFNALLKQADSAPLSAADIIDCARQYGFAETPVQLPALLAEEEGLVFHRQKQQYAARCAPVERPISLLEKRWLAALLLDPRLRLFLDDDEYAALQEKLSGIEPLFFPTDFHFFDQMRDVDPVEDEDYRGHFRTILDAFSSCQHLRIRFLSGKNKWNEGVFLPLHLQYSQKDGKFRLLARRVVQEKIRHTFTINLARIEHVECTPRRTAPALSPSKTMLQRHRIQVAVSNERQTLERCFLHFSHYQCRAYADDKKNVYLNIAYNPSDETELLIRILSFGPMIHVLAPRSFIQLIQERLRAQSALFDAVTTLH